MNNRYEIDSFSEIVKISNNITDICRNLGIGTTKGNRDTVKKYILKYGLDISHFKIIRNINNVNKKELSEILVKDSTYTSTTHLKNRLYKEGLKERICEMCGQNESWNNMKISLILDHINGINNDNRIDNLRIVCPNCNAGLSTNGGKNIGVKYNCENIKKCDCGELITRGSKRCKKCDSLNQRKVYRPEYERLLIEIKDLGYLGVGKKYGVSDNAVRKWKKQYEKIE